MYLAPLKDLNTAVKNAQGLNGLNPTPWAFMMGNCLGWLSYALLSANPYIFLADGTGFLISCWLNLGAIKLMYSNHHLTQTRQSLVKFLQTNDIKMEEEKKAMIQQPSKPYDHDDSSSDSDDDGKEENNNGSNIIPVYDDSDIIPGYDDDEEKGLEINDSIVFTKETDSKDEDMSDKQDESLDLFVQTQESQDKFTPLQSDRFGFSNHNQGVSFGRQKSSVSFENQDSVVSFSKLVSSNEDKQMSMNQLDVFGLQEKPGETPPDMLGETGEKSMTHSMIFSKSKSVLGLFSQKSRKKLSRNMHQSMAHLAESFAKRRQKVNEWGEVVWLVTAQHEPAKAPHETLVMGIIILWYLTFAILGFYCYHSNAEDVREIALRVIGYVVLVNQVFFFGAPLSRINTVIKTRKCDSIHFQSLIANTLNSTLWAAYGIGITDPFVYAPCVLGLAFAVLQFILCAIFPRTKFEEEKRFSITSMLMSHGALGAVREAVVGDIAETAPEKNTHAEEYMTSYGNYSFRY